MKTLMTAWFVAAALLMAVGMAHAQTFGGNECTEDCSGHQAGYRWAERKGITDESDCNGTTNSFVEGCQTFVQDPSRGADEDDDGDDIDE